MTIGCDATDHKRTHIIATQMIVPEEKDGSMITTNFCIDVRQATAKDAESLVEHIKNIFRKLSILCCDDVESASDVAGCQKNL